MFEVFSSGCEKKVKQAWLLYTTRPVGGTQMSNTLIFGSAQQRYPHTGLNQKVI